MRKFKYMYICIYLFSTQAWPTVTRNLGQTAAQALTVKRRQWKGESQTMILTPTLQMKMTTTFKSGKDQLTGGYQGMLETSEILTDKIQMQTSSDLLLMAEEV